MPILPLETDLHPTNFLETQANDEDAAKNWWALYTQSRREKDLMRRLMAGGASFYSPIIPKRTRSPQGRLRTSYQLFVCCVVVASGRWHGLPGGWTRGIMGRMPMPRARRQVAILHRETGTVPIVFGTIAASW